MLVSNLLLVGLPALATAQQQAPFIEKLKSYVDQAQTYLASVTGNPARAASAKAAEYGVTTLTFDNYEEVLRHSGKTKQYNPPEAWMVYITADNATAHGRCQVVDKAWNESIPYFLADTTAPRLATIDCAKDELLCGAWGAGFPSIWFFLLPQPLPDQSPAPTDIFIYNLNATSTTVGDITRIHTRRTYLGMPKYEGALHPFDGWIVKLGLVKPMSYSLYYLSKIPSWAFMIGLTSVSRWFVSKRMPRPAPTAQAGTPAR